MIVRVRINHPAAALVSLHARRWDGYVVLVDSGPLRDGKSAWVRCYGVEMRSCIGCQLSVAERSNRWNSVMSDNRQTHRWVEVGVWECGNVDLTVSR